MFGLGKKAEKKEENKGNCCCGGNCTGEEMERAEQIKAAGGIKVLGGGCSKCHELQKNTEEALAELGLELGVELITDYTVISSYGVMSTPALVINEKVVSYGKVLKTADAKKLLEENL